MLTKEAADREAQEASEREAAAYDPVAEKAKTRAWIDKIYGLPPRPEAGIHQRDAGHNQPVIGPDKNAESIK